MSAAELVVRVLAQVQPLLPYMLIVTAVTTAALAALLFASRGLWVDQRRFQWLGLFFSLSTGDCVRLACAWVKLILLFCYLIAFRALIMEHYLMFLIAGLGYVLSLKGARRIPGRLLWLAVQIVALLSCNLICGYIRGQNGALTLRVLYILMAIFTGLFGIYLFIAELNDISVGREPKLAQE